MNKPKVLVIVGPTASGKSALGIALAQKFNGEVVSADSRQVYRGLNIGTGKVTKKEMSGIPHHLLDVSSPKRSFTADQYRKLAAKSIADITKRGKLPIIVGGTGFYIDSLTGRMSLPEVPPNSALRAKLKKKNASQMYALLLKKDPGRALSMSSESERNNPVRLIRALEIVAALGNVPTPLQQDIYDTLWIGVAMPFEKLEVRIQKRLTERLKIGMIHEAKRLHADGLSYKRMEELGLEYRSLSKFLKNEISRSELEAELSRDIRRYAKRQLTYWNRNQDIRWLSATSSTVSKMIRSWLKS